MNKINFYAFKASKDFDSINCKCFLLESKLGLLFIYT